MCYFKLKTIATITFSYLTDGLTLPLKACEQQLNQGVKPASWFKFEEWFNA